MHLVVVVVCEQHLLCVDQLRLAIQQHVLRVNTWSKHLKVDLVKAYLKDDSFWSNLDVFPPCYEDKGEAKGDEDEEEGSNYFCAAQLVTTYLL